MHNWIRVDAAEALELLDSNAGAAPILIRGLSDCDTWGFYQILSRLRRMPIRETDIDAAIENLARRGQITNAVKIVIELSVCTPTAVRILAKALSIGDSPTKQLSATQLALCGPAAVLALPELKTSLADTNDEVRYKAACVLANIGTNAQSALRELNRSTNDVNPIVRGAATRALRNINLIPTE